MKETLSATELQSVDRATRTVTARIYSGAAVTRRTFDGEYLLQIDLAGVDTARAAAGSMPVLLDHSDRSDSQVGRVVQVWRQGVALYADLAFGTSELAQQIFEDVAAGIRRGVSVGLSVMDSREEFDTAQRRVIVTKAELVEVSIVPIPADGAAVMLAFNPEPEVQTMTTSPTLQPGAAAERERVSTILSLTEKLKGKVPENFASQFIATGSTVEQFRAAIIEHMAAESDATATFSYHSGTVTHDQRDKVNQGIADGLYARATGKTPTDAGRPYVSMSLLDMSRTYLRNAGLSDMGMPSDPMKLAGGALGLVKLGAGMHGTSDFPNILGDTVGRVIQDNYRTAPAALKTICRKRMANDFRTLTPVRLGEFPALEEVTQHGEFHYGPLDESHESYRVKTYGKIIALTRQAIVNDDLSAFSALPRAAGQAVVQLEAQTLVDLLVYSSGVGPTMSDSVALFNTAHGNVAASGAVISDTTLGAARLAMRSQKGVDATTLIDVQPAYLIVPAALETTAQKYLAALQPAQASNVNPFSNALQLIVEPRLDASSAIRWYLAADPGLSPAFEYAYLNGAEGPMTETRVGFEVDGLEFKVRIDFGAAAIDWRGIYKNPGA